MSKTKSFEVAIKELEQVVTQLESDELALERSIELFDQGTKLSQICAEQLEEAQKKIDSLIEKLSVEKQPEA
ncbi:MAG: exodeoxyribonuclease VII small subunit [Bdellovibrionota bacterium]|nr:exodeoxyribonuclease VII small subunit [Deltaproteobacteria bacterium]